MAMLRFHVCPTDRLEEGWNRGMAILNPHPPCPIPSSRSPKKSSSSRIYCSIQSKSIVAGGANSKKEYQPGVFDDIFLNVFRSKMAQEIGWDSEKPGYDGLIDVAHRIMTGRSNTEATEAAVRILISLFPPSLLELYKLLISPIAGGKVAALMVARVTAISCQWLMGPCAVNSVDLPDKSSWSSGVFVEKCRYLEESKCVGVCINTCKLPTQIFFKEHMGVPLVMEPNFDDYSCQGLKNLRWTCVEERPKRDKCSVYVASVYIHRLFLLRVNLLAKSTINSNAFLNMFSSILGYFLLHQKTTARSNSPASRYAQLPTDAGKSAVPRMC